MLCPIYNVPEERIAKSEYYEYWNEMALVSALMFYIPLYGLVYRFGYFLFPLCVIQTFPQAFWQQIFYLVGILACKDSAFREHKFEQKQIVNNTD